MFLSAIAHKFEHDRLLALELQRRRQRRGQRDPVLMIPAWISKPESGRLGTGDEGRLQVSKPSRAREHKAPGATAALAAASLAAPEQSRCSEDERRDLACRVEDVCREHHVPAAVLGGDASDGRGLAPVERRGGVRAASVGRAVGRRQRHERLVAVGREQKGCAASTRNEAGNGSAGTELKDPSAATGVGPRLPKVMSGGERGLGIGHAGPRLGLCV